MVRCRAGGPDSKSVSGSRAARELGLGLSLLAAFLGTGCGKETPPRWIDLVAAGEHVTSSLETGEHVLADGRTVRLSAQGNGVRLELTLTPGDWVRQGPPGFWLAQAALPVPIDDRTNSTLFELTDGARSFAQQPYKVFKKDDDEPRFPPLSFRVGKEGVALHLPKGELPAEEMTLSYVLHADGSSSGRIRGPHFSGRGFQVWPGQTLRMVVDVPEGAVLRFATTLDPQGGQASAGAKPTVFRVLQDGEPVFEHEELDPTQMRHEWHAAPLLRSGRRSELAFLVRGSFANTCFLDPVLGPKDVGARGRRPWAERRPDVVLFLADTFRADNMDAYGGQLGLTPELDRFARNSLFFRRAWSVGTYTLPAHVSMFTGVLPLQAGLNDTCNSIPDDLDTIAEMLSAAGYRTGAITAAGYVSHRFGFDQGFAYFNEDRAGLDASIAAQRALGFLDADDGRPVFLFVQTYETHKPYLVSAETRERLGARLGIQGEFAEIEGRLKALTGDGSRLPADPTVAAAASAVVRETRAHYFGAVADLDRAFGLLHGALGERGWFEHGWLVFTSDHGEAFAEHGEITHCGTVFEEKIRIPLVIKGPGTAPRVIDQSASLVDMVPTLADITGLAKRPEWMGESLLSLAQDRPVFSFGLGPSSTIAVIEGSRKVIGYEVERTVDAHRILGGFDLRLDPLEQQPVGNEAEAWPRDMLRRFGPELERSFQPLVEGRPAQLGQQDLEELHKLGYVDGFDG